jgi:TnpA family transposase
MTSRERTAYPVFLQTITPAELAEFYTPTDSESALVEQAAKGDLPRLALTVLLKSFQKLGYLPLIQHVPPAVVQHIAEIRGIALKGPLRNVSGRSRVRYRQIIHHHLNVTPYGDGGQATIEPIIRQATLSMSDPADLINVAIEQLILNRYELPGYSTLDQYVNHLRHQVHLSLYQQVTDKLSSEEKTLLDGLLKKAPDETRYPVTQLKALPATASLKTMQAWEAHLAWMEDLLDPNPHIVLLTHTKMEQFATEAYQLEVSDLRDIRSNRRRRTLLLCLLHQMQVRTRDQLTTMFLKRVRAMHNSGKKKLRELQDAYRAMSEEVTDTFAQIVDKAAESIAEIADDTQQKEQDAVLGQQVRQILKAGGGIDYFKTSYQLLSALHDNNYLPLMQGYHQRYRGTFFRLTRRLQLHTASQNRQLLDALVYVHQTQYGPPLLDDEIDLDFAASRWRNLIRKRVDGQWKLQKEHLQACVFSYLADGLRNGDLYIAGAEQFADYRTQLLEWSECETLLQPYCQAVEIPATASDFLNGLRQQLEAVALRVDHAQAADSDLYFDEDGKPHLRRLPKQPEPAEAKTLQEEMQSRLPERHLLDLLHHTHRWVPFTRHFGPPSGSDSKLSDPIDRYLITIFSYGCNLGPTQTARHLRDGTSARVLGKINAQHITTAKLESALQDVVDEYSRFRLPLFWGKPNVAVADGTHYELHENNLLGERHIRYGAYGGIAYHHISDTYVALFSHFIACGMWEAVYILDGLLKNKAILQPDTVHADTQGQSEVVFGLAHLLGIQLMPRMRNWNKVTMYRSSKSSRYQNIDGWFTRTINWEILHDHWQDLMQVVLSIHKGKVLPSWLLQKLVSDNPKNKLYLALRELGCVIRTLFLLEFASNAPLRAQIQAATTKIEAYNLFSQWIFFGGDGLLITSRDPVAYEKRIKYKDLIANSIMLHNVVDMTHVLHDMSLEGFIITPEVVATFSPYMTEHVKRFGEYFIDMNSVPPPFTPDKPFLSAEIQVKGQAR